jgi:glycosyltransferase involved in cell wall biosynthesis
LKPGIQTILIVDGREETKPEFFVRDISRFKSRNSQARCVHRVNECDLRKGTSHVDASLLTINGQADVTVFISEWLKGYFMERWEHFPSESHVIINAGDDRVFHPSEQFKPADGQRWRVVTHHWSSHWNKGWGLYKEVDDLIANGELPGFTLTVIGNHPENVRWKSARCISPLWGISLADELRRHRIYLTASRWEPGGYHVIEGLQCGLPLVYHEDGGGIVEVGRKYGVGFGGDVGPALREAAERYDELRQKILDDSLSGRKMCKAYASLLFPEATFSD